MLPLTPDRLMKNSYTNKTFSIISSQNRYSLSPQAFAHKDGMLKMGQQHRHQPLSTITANADSAKRIITKKRKLSEIDAVNADKDTDQKTFFINKHCKQEYDITNTALKDKLMEYFQSNIFNFAYKANPNKKTIDFITPRDMEEARLTSKHRTETSEFTDNNDVENPLETSCCPNENEGNEKSPRYLNADTIYTSEVIEPRAPMKAKHQPPPLLFRPSGIASDSEDDEEYDDDEDDDVEVEVKVVSCSNGGTFIKQYGSSELDRRSCSCPDMNELKGISRSISPRTLGDSLCNYSTLNQKHGSRRVYSVSHNGETPLNNNKAEIECSMHEGRCTSCPPNINTTKCLNYLLPQTLGTFSRSMDERNGSKYNGYNRPQFYASEAPVFCKIEETDASDTSAVGSRRGVSTTDSCKDAASSSVVDKEAMDQSTDAGTFNSSGFPVHETKRLKQEKNKEASKNYRDRKKRKHMEILQKEAELKKKNAKLNTQIKDIEQDIAAFENDLAKKINTQEKIKRQICTLLLRDLDGNSRDADVERTIMQRILEKITSKHGDLVKQAFYEIWTGVSKSKKSR